MAAGPKHPANMMWLLTKVFLFLAIVFSIIAIWLPQWSRIKGTGIPTSSLKLIDSTAVTTNSRLWLGLWRWCLDYQDVDDVWTCADWDNEGSSYPPGFGDPKCRGYTYATRILGLIGFGLCVLALVVCLLVFMSLGKWAKGGLWKAPMIPALLAILLILLAFGCLLASWICWIVVAEHGCQNTTRTTAIWDPFQGYSTCFILMVFASAWAFIALLTACLGLLKIKKTPALMYPEQPVYVPEVTYPVEPMYMAPAYPTYPTAVPEYPIAPQYATVPEPYGYPTVPGFGSYGAY